MLTQPTVHQMVDDHCRACSSAKNGFCGLLQKDSLAAFSKRSHRVLYRQGDEIAAQGEHLDKIGVIASGLAKIVTITENGEEYLLQILRPGEFVGDPKGDQSGFAWEAATDLSICWLPRTAWSEFLREHPQHSQAYIATIGMQIDEARHTVMRMRGRNTVQRVAYWLVEQAPKPRADKLPEVRIVLTRRDLASLLDMTVETLCRALHQLDDRKVINLLAPDHVEITDLARLQIMAKWQDDRVQRTLAMPGVRHEAMSELTSSSPKERSKSARPRVEMTGFGNAFGNDYRQ